VNNDLKQLNAIVGRYQMEDLLIDEHARLLKGFEGELQFDLWLANERYLKLNDVYLKIENSTIQLDSVLFIDDKIIAVDIKNYSSKYRVIDNHWSNEYRTLPNPLESITRQHFLLSKLFPKQQIVMMMVFINPKFSIDKAFHNKNIYMHYDRLRLLNDLKNYGHSNSKSLKHLNHMKRYITDGSIFMKNYDFSDKQIKSGILCSCRKEISSCIQPSCKYTVCKYCNTKHNTKELIRNNIIEWITIHKRPITYKEACIWCEGVSGKTIQRVLTKYFIREGKNRNYKYRMYN